MAGGPIGWDSAVPDTSGEVFPSVYVTSASQRIEGLGVTTAALLTANRFWDLIFQMPEVLPTGSIKLRLRSMGNGTTGNLIVAPDWVTGDPSGFDPDATLNDEGTTTITWATVDIFIETKIALDVATAPAAGESLFVSLQFNDVSTTVTFVTTHLVDIIWE